MGATLLLAAAVTTQAQAIEPPETPPAAAATVELGQVTLQRALLEPPLGSSLRSPETACGPSASGSCLTPVLLPGYPLAQGAPQLVNYGWHMGSMLNEAVFHGGVGLAAAVGDRVLAVGTGTVAFAGEQGDYGQLVVINHAQGVQTRYAHLSAIAVEVGQVIEAHELVGRVGQTGVPVVRTAHLHFEVRRNSPVGWVAQDPADYLASPLP